MSWWSLAQALAWIMWRDEDRANAASDGDVAPLLARKTRDLPDDDPDALVRWLLENGEVEFVPVTRGNPHRGWERRWGTEERTGHMVYVEGWRERQGGPLCTYGELNWRPKREEPAIGLKDAKEELLSALRDGRVRAAGEANAGRPVEIPAIEWLYNDLRLSEDGRLGGHTGVEGYRGASASSRTRLRFPTVEIKALWPASRQAREAAGAAAGKWYRDDAVDKAAGEMLAREAKGRSTSDDDIKATLENLANKYEDGGADKKTIGRWVRLVRARMDQLRRPPA